MVRDVAGELAGQAAVVQIDTRENPSLANRFAIQGIPALLILKKGRVVARIGGSRSKGTIIDWFGKSGA